MFSNSTGNRISDFVQHDLKITITNPLPYTCTYHMHVFLLRLSKVCGSSSRNTCGFPMQQQSTVINVTNGVKSRLYHSVPARRCTLSAKLSTLQCVVSHQYSSTTAKDCPQTIEQEVFNIEVKNIATQFTPTSFRSTFKLICVPADF